MGEIEQMGNGTTQLRSEEKTKTNAENIKSLGKTSTKDLTNGRSLLLEKKSSVSTDRDLTSKNCKNGNCKSNGFITNAEQLSEHFKLSEKEKKEIDEVAKIYPMRISKSFLGKIKAKGDALWKQAVPAIEEIQDKRGDEDPLNEEKDQPVPGVPLTHRYPNKVLFKVSRSCAMLCRFCTRKREVERENAVTETQILQGLKYIRENEKVHDVLLSGGDPLMLEIDQLEFVLERLKRIPHIRTLRIGTRVPCTAPEMITDELVEMLKKYRPSLRIGVHFEHPDEIDKASKEACVKLSYAGFPLYNQNVHLKGVNDDTKVLSELYWKLTEINVDMEYIYLADFVQGTAHFWTTPLELVDHIKALRGRLPGFAIPVPIVDLPNGGGKVPLDQDHVVSIGPRQGLFKNWKGEMYYRIVPPCEPLKPVEDSATSDSKPDNKK